MTLPWIAVSGIVHVHAFLLADNNNYYSHCLHVHTKVGFETRVCLDSGRWSGLIIVCLIM